MTDAKRVAVLERIIALAESIRPEGEDELGFYNGGSIIANAEDFRDAIKSEAEYRRSVASTDALLYAFASGNITLNGKRLK